MNRIVCVVALSIISLHLSAQSPFEVSQDPKHPEVKVLKGTITKEVLKNDTSFKWYAESQGYYTPEAAVLKTFKDSANQFQFVIFGGTWCDDSQYILPKFFKLQEQSGLPDKNITFFGVDRNKETLGNIASAFNITNVPTIIIMKDGKEIGRVVEYGKTGRWDKELAEILVN